MQAIWTLEPPDQRYLRLHNVRVPVLELERCSYQVQVQPEPDLFAYFRPAGTERHRATMHGTLKHHPNGSFPTKLLVEVAERRALGAQVALAPHVVPIAPDAGDPVLLDRELQAAHGLAERTGAQASDRFPHGRRPYAVGDS